MSRHPLVGGPPAAGRQRVFAGADRCVVACSLESVWSLAIAGAQGTGACSRLSRPVPGPRGGRGHTCRTPPRACSVSSATSLSVSARLARSRRTRCNRGCGTCGAGPFWSIGGRRAATTPSVQCCDRGLGCWPRGHVKEGTVPDATGITPSGVCEGRLRANRR